ncbi:MAG TPA: cobyrinate a,c-diamide synthase [Acetobacteraceae bacterium]|nr:cobyrinate a,c-diamide synthase [Acetobacteraceae bacterium]
MRSTASSPSASPPGLVIAAPRSGSGKTTLTLGLLRALRRSGVAVGSAKCGPDYIDPPFHRAASGRACVNLDSWAMPPALIAVLAAQVGIGCDLIICEALMGLFDGVPGPAGRTGSSADVAAALGWPVLLVLDVSGQSQSAAAIAKGFATYDTRLTIAGVVLNRVGSPRHARLATEAIEAIGIPVVGKMNRSADVALPERHLGLVQADETSDLDARLEQMADFVTAHTQIDVIRSLAARGSPALFEAGARPPVPPPGQRIAVAQDAAFSFLYPHVLQGWRTAGAELQFFSPLADEAPDGGCDVCWLAGGYPELHAGRLAGSHKFLEGLHDFAETRPVHGECGGYMVLGRALTDADGVTHKMAGLLGASTSFARRKLHLGYRIAHLVDDTCLGSAGTQLRGHEFHYASIDTRGGDAAFALVSDAYGAEPSPSGSRRGLVSGSFFHVIAVAS